MSQSPRKRKPPTLPADVEPAVDVDDDSTTESRPATSSALPIGYLRVLHGPAKLRDRAFPFYEGEISIGRARSCDLCIPHAVVSRLHGMLACRENRVELIHRSGTNTTRVNGALVEDRQALGDGDQILLSEEVLLRCELLPAPRRRDPGRDRSLFDVLQARLDLDRDVARFERVGAFLDVDVAGSYQMKVTARRVDHLIVSFERFRAFVIRTAEAGAGTLLSSNGDEVMLYFETADEAVQAAQAILHGLASFNRDENLLTTPFEVRAGIHYGKSIVDVERGIAYSAELDTAGHLQKQADIDALLISQDTLDHLTHREGFVDAGMLERHDVRCFQWRSPTPNP